jgi:PAS domain-containing protein
MAANRCERCGAPIIQPRTGRRRRFCSDSCRSLYRRQARRFGPPQEPAEPAPEAAEAGLEAEEIRARRLEVLERLLQAIREDGVRLYDPAGRIVGIHPAVEPARRYLADLERAQPTQRVVHRLDADEDPVLRAIEGD